MERHGVSPKQFAPRAIQSAISDAKNALVEPAEYERMAFDPFSKAVAPVFKSMSDALRLANAVDFDDLLVLPVRMLQRHAERLARYRDQFKYILVDEYQDTNRAQYELIKLLGGQHGNVCVVGDDDQSIYGWRGADIANVVISANTTRMGKTLRATRGGGEAITLVRSLDERDEADFVVGEIGVR